MSCCMLQHKMRECIPIFGCFLSKRSKRAAVFMHMPHIRRKDSACLSKLAGNFPAPLAS